MAQTHSLKSPERRWFFAKLTAALASVPVISRLVPRTETKPSPTKNVRTTVTINPMAVARENKDRA